MKRIFLAALVSIAMIAPLALRPAAAADVNATVVAANFEYHLSTAGGTTPPTITATAGDRILFRIENDDTTTPHHSFTSPHFNVNITLADGTTSAPTVAFVNITTAATDAGTWQFYCIPHSSVSGSTRTGMVGSIVVQAKPTPGFEVLAVVGAIAAAFVAVAVIHRRRP